MNPNSHAFPPSAWTMRADGGFANLVVALCPPLTLLLSSDWSLFTWIGGLAIAVAAIAAVASLLLSGEKPSIYAILIGATIACLIAVGWVPHGLTTTQAYVQIVQLLIFGIIVSDYRRAVAGSNFYLISLGLVGLILIVNFTQSAVVELIVSNRNWTSPVFENSNVFGISCAVLTIFGFMSSRVVLASRLRLITYLVCAVLVFFIAASGSRGALLIVLVFFFVYMIGTAFNGSKTLLRGGAALTLLMVPVFTLGYPAALGSHINFLPAPVSQGSSAGSTTPTCVPTSFEVCPAVQRAAKSEAPDRRSGGFLGLKKRIGSGRQNIWPAVFEMAGRSPIWGHGLGALPGAYLAPPYTGTHAHSGFLQVYYQFGLIGVALYVLLWCLLFSRAIAVMDISARSAAVAVLCAACVLETFEVVLIQNLLGIGIALGILATTEFTSKTSGPAVRDFA